MDNHSGEISELSLIEHRSSTPVKKAATGTTNLLLKIDERKSAPDLSNILRLALIIYCYSCPFLIKYVFMYTGDERDEELKQD